AGSTKYALGDLRLVAERASARETAARVAAGSLAKLLLAEVDVQVHGYVVAIGNVVADLDGMSYEERVAGAAESDVACPDADAAVRMRAAIDTAKAAGDSLGGVVEVVAWGLPVGLGSHVHWDRRLDGRLAQAVMSIQAIKGVEIGLGFANASLPGTEVHDALYWDEDRVVRRTNRAGGLEGGITNGSPVVIRAAMKPIPTTVKPQATVDLATGEPATTQYQRSDVCAAPAAAVVAEAMVAFVLTDALLERYGSDVVADLVARVRLDVSQ
ncbi:MAG: chorismate synthase, partial [Anaerolineae bacterium]